MSCSTMHKPTLWTTYNQQTCNQLIAGHSLLPFMLVLIFRSTHLVCKLFVQLSSDSLTQIDSKMPRFYPHSIFHFGEDKHFVESNTFSARQLQYVCMYCSTGVKLESNGKRGFQGKVDCGKDENRIKLGMPHCGPNYGSISVVNLFMYAFSKFSGKDVL